MTRVVVDSERCQGHARCVLLAPYMFDIDDDSVSFVVEPQPAIDDDVREAIVSCPQRAISVVT